MIAKPGHKFAVRMRFADEEAPRWLTHTRDVVISVHGHCPPLAICHRDDAIAQIELKRIGMPWSQPLVEEPHVVELDVTVQLHEHAAKLRGDLASLDEELALTYTYPRKEQSDAGA